MSYRLDKYDMENMPPSETKVRRLLIKASLAKAAEQQAGRGRSLAAGANTHAEIFKLLIPENK